MITESSFFDFNDVVKIVESYTADNDCRVVDFKFKVASDKMMGFLADYAKLEVLIRSETGDDKTLHFFVKSICRNNAGKADMVKEMNLFPKEAIFYGTIKPCLEIPGIQPWAPRLAVVFETDLVLEDLTASGYRPREKLDKFDLKHCKRALESIARFHAGSIVYEEKMRNQGRDRYTLQEDFEPFLDKGGYTPDSSWFIQCALGGLEAVKEFSRYAKSSQIQKIEHEWRIVFNSSLDLSNAIKGRRNVICHRDLWNNNLLYHYDSNDVPDDCVLVDYQAVRYQPPAGDIMVFLYCCNTDTKTIERLLPDLLRHYHEYLSIILEKCGIHTSDVLPFQELLETSEEQRKWGMVVACCLLPTIFCDDTVTATFTDSDQFDQIMTKHKGRFIKKIMTEDVKYRSKLLERFEDLIDKYILN